MFELTANVKKQIVTFKSWIRMENGTVAHEYTPDTEFHLAAHEESAMSDQEDSKASTQDMPSSSSIICASRFMFVFSVLHLVASF